METKTTIPSILFIILLLVGGGYLLGRSRGADRPFQYASDLPNTPPPENATVATVIDPITIQLDTGHVIRYLGVRSPNVTNEIECFGKEALKANESTIGREVRLESDPLLERSQDGAWARYVYLVPEEASPTPEPTPTPEATPETEEPASPSPEESTAETAEDMPEQQLPPAPEEAKEIFINERILEGGFGFPVLAPDMKYGERMLSAARFASATGKGLWSRCELSEDTPGQSSTQVIEECTIKGKVTSDFKKLYRTPECAAYAQTMVVESQGGRWFCAEDIARDEGFEKAPDCPSE